MTSITGAALSRAAALRQESPRSAARAAVANGHTVRLVKTEWCECSNLTIPGGAGVGSDHMVLKKMADLEAKVLQERQVR